MASKIKRTADEDLAALARVEGEKMRARGGLTLRLLICNRCRSVWPTERDPTQGGSRSDGDPCAYRWPDGRVCQGNVYPVDGSSYQIPPEYSDEDEETERPAPRAAYGGRWCEVLGVPWGTTDLALVRKCYRTLAKTRHPDAGGSHREMVELNDAYRQALAELGQRT